MLASFLRRNPAPAKAPVDRGRIDAQILKALDKTLDGQKTAAALIGRLKRDCDALRCEIDVLRREIARRDAGPRGKERGAAASVKPRKTAGARTARARAPE